MKPRCDLCPLRMYWEKKDDWSPVDSELNEGSVLMLGDAPSKQDSIYNKPFVGPSGVEAISTLEALGKRRKDVAWANVCGCRFPDDNPKAFLAGLQKRNRHRVRKKLDPHPSPMECCKPRLQHELEGYSNIIPMGDLATKAVLPGNPSLSAVRGGPTSWQGKKILPTFHPSYTIYQPIWRPIFKLDLAKAFRHFSDSLKWKSPSVIYTPSPKDLEEFIHKVRVNQQAVAYDVETDALEPLTAGLRCVGIGTEDEVLIIPFLSVDGEAKFYSPTEEERIRDLLVTFFRANDICKVGHNAGYYDRLVIEQHLHVTPSPLVDTIILSRLAESEYPNGLGYLGSVLTDVPAWKADRTATTTDQDTELHAYCAVDVAVTARIAKTLLRQAKQRKQRKLYHTDAQLQNICVGMHRLGMRVDEDRRQKHMSRLMTEISEWKKEIDHNLNQKLNPNSPVQVQELLFDKWSLPPHSYTSTGEPSSNDAALRSLIGNPLVDEDQRAVINAIRHYRRASKLFNTYIMKLSPGLGVVVDGVVHPDYNVHGTISGRFSSSNPNFQNIPYKLRDMFIPPKGMVFVGADYDQLELRFVAALAGAKHYLDAFTQGEIDPHNLTGQMMFGESFWHAEGAPTKKIEKGSGAFKKLRDLAKTICFASLYGASPPKVHEIITKAEDDEGNLLYSHYTLRQVRALHRKWMRAAPQFKAWWVNTAKDCRRDGYIEEVVLKRRRYFVDLEDRNAIINFGVQAGGFSVVTLGMLEILKHLPFDFQQGTGLVNQLHDSVLFAVEESRAEWACERLTQSLACRIPGLPVDFTAEAKIGNRWSDV